MIVGGKKNSYDIDDYVIASLNLYLDVTWIFLDILELINNLTKKDENS